MVQNGCGHIQEGNTIIGDFSALGNEPFPVFASDTIGIVHVFVAHFTSFVKGFSDFLFVVFSALWVFSHVLYNTIVDGDSPVLTLVVQIGIVTEVFCAKYLFVVCLSILQRQNLRLFLR